MAGQQCKPGLYLAAASAACFGIAGAGLSALQITGPVDIYIHGEAFSFGAIAMEAIAIAVPACFLLGIGFLAAAACRFLLSVRK